MFRPPVTKLHKLVSLRHQTTNVITNREQEKVRKQKGSVKYHEGGKTGEKNKKNVRMPNLAQSKKSVKIEMHSMM